MLDKIPGNFKKKYKYNEEGLNCTECLTEMTQFHCTIFPATEALREGLDMSQLDDAVIYFRYLSLEKKKSSGAGT